MNKKKNIFLKDNIVWREFRKHKGAMVGLVILTLIILTALIAPLLIDYETKVIEINTSQRLQGPSREHIFGTDSYGRDLFSRVIYAMRPSLAVGIVAVSISLLIGSSLGIIAGYYGGVIENIIMRICDVFVAIPSVLLAISIASAFGQSLIVLMFAIGIVAVANFAVVARASVLSVRDQEYIEAAVASGARDHQIILKHIVPNSLAPILVQATMRMATAILMASSLSFLGLGIPAPRPEWGGMLAESRTYIRDYSYLMLFPGLAIVITVLSINLIGDGLRDALDPKLRS